MSLYWSMIGTAARGSVGAGQSVASTDRAIAKVEELSRKLQRAEERVEQLALISEAVWSLAREKLGVSEDALAERVKELDLSDGQLDGRVRRPPMACPHCGRTLSKRFEHCLYCGKDLGPRPFA